MVRKWWLCVRRRRGKERELVEEEEVGGGGWESKRAWWWRRRTRFSRARSRRGGKLSSQTLRYDIAREAGYVVTPSLTELLLEDLAILMSKNVGKIIDFNLQFASNR